jgi:GNAT superfamily N-acetyltransferase
VSVEEGLFDKPVIPSEAAHFLADPGHHMVVALDGDTVVAMASATVVRHPDKPPELFINEVGTRDSHQRRGLATRLVKALIEWARAAGHKGIWLATEEGNAPSRGLYGKLGARETGGVVVYDWDGAMDD